MAKDRRIYNLFLNAPRPKTTNRKFSQVDLFPTILEALGANIKGHRLGIGVSVFSDKKTLSEEYKRETLYKELSKRSKLNEDLWKI